MSSGCGINGDIIKTYVVDDIPGASACTISTDVITSCSLTGITLTDSIYPEIDGTIDLGTPIKRFRDINTISGTSTVWTVTQITHTPIVDLGLDLSAETRQITANNSIIQDDILWGGEF